MLVTPSSSLLLRLLKVKGGLQPDDQAPHGAIVNTAPLFGGAACAAAQEKAVPRGKEVPKGKAGPRGEAVPLGKAVPHGHLGRRPGKSWRRPRTRHCQGAIPAGAWALATPLFCCHPHSVPIDTPAEGGGGVQQDD